MKKILKYELVAAQDKKWLNDMVNNLIKFGYQPMGNPQITVQTGEGKELIIVYSQVMVIYEEN